MVEDALVILGDDGFFVIVTFIEKSEGEGTVDIAENLRIFRPVDDGARGHNGGDIAVGEALAREVGHGDHLLGGVFAFAAVEFSDFAGDDFQLIFGSQVIQHCYDIPAIHLPLVDGLRAVVNTGGVAEANGVGSGEQAEIGVWRDDAILVEQGKFAVGFEDALDDKHHVGPACIIFIKHQCDRACESPGQNPLAEFGDLFAVFERNDVAANKVGAADMAVEIDADTRPVQACGDLLDMGGFTGAVEALNQHAAVMYEPR